jgi:hypothetical protein
MLATGPTPVHEIEEAAKANLISRNTLKRAKSDLGVTAKRFGKGWGWQLPPMPKTRASDD